MIPTGTLLQVLRPMRAWENDRERGYEGTVIEPGTRALLLQTWEVGNQVRLRVIANDHILLFSNPRHTVTLNWEVVSEAKVTPSET